MNEDVVKAREVLHNIGGHDYDSCGNYPLERREAEKIINILNAFISKNGEKVDVGELSDGYHTFNQLYHQRAVLFACIVKQNKNKAWKSFKHSDGKYCFDSDGGWFIVGVDTPQGSYTYHYAKEYWDMFDCQELECGKEWDGHTEKDVIRLLSLEQQPCENCISREDALKAIEEQKKGFYGVERYAIDECHSAVMKLPSVRPYKEIVEDKRACEKCIHYVTRDSRGVALCGCDSWECEFEEVKK